MTLKFLIKSLILSEYQKYQKSEKQYPKNAEKSLKKLYIK